MTGSPRVVEILNALLAGELASIVQSMTHSGMCAKWGYGKLQDNFDRRAIDEMKHARDIIGRILFLGGNPVVSRPLTMHLGSELPNQLENDRVAEVNAVEAYGKAIVVANEVADFETREMLGKMMTDEERHIGEIKELQVQITQMTLSVFLSKQVSASHPAGTDSFNFYYPYTR